MSKTDFELPPLPPDITALLAAERGRPGPSSESQTRMLGSICTTLGLPVPVGPGPGPTGGGNAGATGSGIGSGAAGTAGGRGLSGAIASAVKPATLIAFALGITVGAGTVAVLKKKNQVFLPASTSHQASTPEGTQPVLYVPTVTPREQPPQETAAPSAAPRERDAARIHPATRGASEATQFAQGDLDAERNLLEMARTALSRGRAEDALKALQRHRAKFPASHLVEEREGLAILALISNGSVTEAKAKAARFRARYPKSLLRAVVEESLRKTQATK